MISASRAVISESVSLPRRVASGRERQSATILHRALGITLAALLVLPIAEATQPAEAGKKFKTITRTFSSNGQIEIPTLGNDEGPANPYPSTIDVDGFEKYKKTQIKDVNLTLRGFSHEFAKNVDVMLALGNRRALVMADTGNPTDVSDLTITLDDQAVDALPENVVMTSGTFRPANYAGPDLFPAPAPVPNANVALSSFNDLKPEGTWRLFIHDDAGASIGELSNGWQLQITVKAKKEKKHKKNN